MVVGEFEVLVPSQSWVGLLRSRTQLLKLALGISLMSAAIAGLTLKTPQGLASTASFKPTLVSQAVAKVHPNLSNPAPSATAPAPAAAPTPPPAVPTAHVVAVPNCTPDTSYSIPAQLNVAASPTGLTQSIDPPAYYRVYGNSSAQVHAQLQQCAPGDEFSGVTGYSLAWQYDTTDNGSDTCTISNVKVGLHINMALPQWQPSSGAAAGLATEWQKFITGLTTHENGHVAIDQQYGTQLLNDLQAYPATDCGSVAAGIQAKASADITSLNAANDAYDARTNHGATQGAILP